jgi:hypothetical protein
LPDGPAPASLVIVRGLLFFAGS